MSDLSPNTLFRTTIDHVGEHGTGNHWRARCDCGWRDQVREWNPAVESSKDHREVCPYSKRK